MSHARPLVLVSSNRKGGCGKSTTVFNLGGEAARRLNRTLLIDTDPQASLSQSIKPFGSRIIEELPPDRSVVALFDDRMDPDPERVIHRTEFDRLDIVPACDALTRFNYPDPTEHGFLQDSLRQFVYEVSDRYEVVVIDTPPNLQMLTFAALVAADYCLTPVPAEDFASQGIRAVRQFVELVQATRNHDLRWMGILISMLQRIAIHQVYREMLVDTYPQFVLEAVVPLATPYKESVSLKTPMTLHKPNNAAGKAVVALFDEVLQRTGESHPNVLVEIPKPVKKSRSKKTTTTTAKKKAA
ncbi:MAG: hypothetical protein CMJ58_12605 [Planctomycetaceae bacterium]|nr:hypothetical protein [Planctomycetaceae bacterium]